MSSLKFLVSRNISYLKVSRCHVTVPQSSLLASLVERALQLLAESLGVLPSLVLGHPEQHGSGVGG